MSVNDRSVGGAVGVDTYPGVANPTSSSDTSNPMVNNFVTDSTSEERGAGAGANFEGDRQAARNFSQTSGVVEGRPGVIESSNIHPLNENSNKGRTTENFTSTAASKVTDVANKAYEMTMGQNK
ncbi:hypothetical protein C8J55DRAFT_539923 [Lentinula edodes]|uniref:Uncharacterized protein n=1 Tax=Lentinula lateritia TaxID=40482 RepID=A0A9W9AYG8_9AGAR|nr:hypothetical protein C8J55DRAFT_539923 [Lentinula edodes]